MTQAGDAMEMEQEDADDGLPGITDAVANRFQEISAQLNTARKQRGKAFPKSLSSVDDVCLYTETASHNGIHSASLPGITCLDLQVIFQLLRFSSISRDFLRYNFKILCNVTLSIKIM